MHGLILDLASCHGEPIGIAASSTSTKAVRAVAGTSARDQVLQHGSTSLTLPLSPPPKTM
ncbi:hypothetical protein L916_02649 [Phytophthora nicotianae]|uniref:Uncharacterized protein n=1 Tax=Phytophthora nicotianae TaxID=4792 RepID=W2JPI5_PHYNI|nr:hypothetical protein L916_02649 [Phytophthora nicotianae]